MKLKEILKNKKIDYDVPVLFKSGITSDGKKVMTLITDTGKRYVIDASIKNFHRFKKWEHNKSYADIQTFKSITLADGIKYPTARITTEVDVRKDKIKDDDSF